MSATPTRAAPLRLALALTLAAGCAGGGAPGAADSAPGGSNDSAPGASDDSGAPEDDSPPVEVALEFDGPAPKNVLMIALDTLRRDSLGRYSGDWVSPNLDQILSEGVALDAHRSCSNWTYDSILCAQTGESPIALGFVPSTEWGVPEPAPTSLTLFSEILRDAGYSTALWTAQQLMSETYHMSEGFDEERADLNQDADVGVRQALELLDALRSRGGPWYLHLHFVDPHLPYAPYALTEDEQQALWGDLEPLEQPLEDLADYHSIMGEYDAMSEDERALMEAHFQARYRGEVLYLDQQLGLLWEELEARGALSDTLVVIWSDHGEQLYQHGAPTHGASLYREENDAIAAFWAEGLRQAAWTGPTTHADLWPTAAAAIGIAHGEVSGLPLGQASEDRIVTSHRHSGLATLQSAAQGDLKLIYEWSGERELYDLAADPDETQDLYDPDRPEVEALWGALLPEVEALHAVHGGDAPVDPGP